MDAMSLVSGFRGRFPGFFARITPPNRLLNRHYLENCQCSQLQANREAQSVPEIRKGQVIRPFLCTGDAPGIVCKARSQGSHLTAGASVCRPGGDEGLTTLTEGADE